MLAWRAWVVARVSGAYAAPKRTWYISTINLFEGLSQSEIDKWVGRCGVRSFEPGQRIIDARSTPPELVLVIRRGAVRLLLEHANRRSETVDLLGPGQLLGVSAAFGGSPTVLHADAQSRVVACLAEGRRFLADLASYPDLVLNLVRQAGVRLMQYGAGDFQAQQPSAEVRLAEALKRLALTAGEPVGEGTRIPDCVSRGTLAHLVGCTRETVARMLSNLEASGGVVRQGRAIVVDTHCLDGIIKSGAAITFQEQGASRA
jgi:CRP/FNR family transcriptional regulator, cyclic AMP receptor protein